MAVRFEQSADTITIVQKRRAFRITMYAIGVCWLLGLVMMVTIQHHATATRLRCEHGAACTLDRDRHTIQLALGSASFDGTDPHWITLHPSDGSRVIAVCGTRDDASEARAFADDLAAFLADPRHAPVDLHCTGHDVGGPDLWLVGPISLLGWALVVLLFARFSVETRVVLDRRAGTAELAGRGWFRRSWKLSRPLSEIRAIEPRRRYAGEGQYAFSVHAVFDDRSVLLWSPAAAKLATIDERVAALRALIA